MLNFLRASLIAALIALAASAGWADISLSGTWTVNQSNTSGTLVLSQQGDLITGNANFPGMPTGAVRGTVTGSKVQFVITFSPGLHGVYTAERTPDGNQMVGGETHPQEGGAGAKWSATRKISGVAGKWRVDQSNTSGTLVFSQQGDQISGTANFPGMPTGAVRGTVTGATVKFVITFSAGLHGVYTAQLTSDGNQMTRGETHPQEGGSGANWSGTRIP